MWEEWSEGEEVDRWCKRGENSGESERKEGCRGMGRGREKGETMEEREQ